MPQNLKLAISMDDVRHILGPAFRYAFDGAVKHGECAMCKKKSVETVIKDLWLGPYGTIFINGWCLNCKFKRQRTIDTHEFPDAHDLAMNLRELRIEVLGGE